MTQMVEIHRDTLAHIERERDEAVASVRRIFDAMHDGDMPDYGNLPQTDLASRSYVKLASVVDEEAEKLGL